MNINSNNLHSQYILVFQQNDKDLAGLIFDQNTRIIKSKIINSIDHFLTKLLVKVFADKIICLYSTFSGWTIAILDNKNLTLKKIKELDLKENEKLSICPSCEGIDIFTDDNIIKFNWNLKKLYKSLENESFFLENRKRILQTETKYDKYFILYKEKVDYSSKLKLAIMNKQTGIIEKSVEVESEQFFFDSKSDLIFVWFSKIKTLNKLAEWVDEYNTDLNIFYEKILFINDSRDEIKIWNENGFSIEFFE